MGLTVFFRAARLALVAAGALSLGACALVPAPPGPVSTAERLSAFPTDGLDLTRPVTIRWSPRQVPFIEAETDADAAYALGLVHAHLRLGQMATLRRLIQGRLSESAGPFATELDAALRAFDFYRATDQAIAEMPPETRRWVARYTAGVNAYAERLGDDALPHEFALLAVDWEPWTVRDSVTIGRAAGVDVNWFTLLGLLAVPDAALRERLFERAAAIAGAGTTTFGGERADLELDDMRRLEASGLAQIAALTRAFPRTGSNSFVVAPDRSATGAPIIANDPHLGFLIPNAWVIAGLRTPDTAMVGMMVPGTSVFGFGRTEDLAWGGTNLLATTSQLVDVSGLAPEEIRTAAQEIGVRFWFDETVETRETAYGPILSDLPPLPTATADGPTFAVRWAGHLPSDEITALLGAMRADSILDFRAAMATFGLPPQTFLVAERTGKIGGVVAARVPRRPAGDPIRLLVDPETSDAHWREMATSLDFPMIVNPPEGFLASSNNRPTNALDFAYGGFFGQDERIRRLRALVGAEPRLTVQGAMAIQQDTVSPVARALLASLAPKISALDPGSAMAASARTALLEWDGDYAAESRGALVFEAFLSAAYPSAYAALGRPGEGAALDRLGLLKVFFAQDLAALPTEDADAALSAGLVAATQAYESGQVWGDIHRLRVQHIFGNLPLIGDRYLIDDIPVGGSQETIFKTAHETTAEPHVAAFGAQSRHVSDLSNPDENYFVLFGGQDGWIGSESFADQVALWREGGYVRVPLAPESVRRAHPIAMVLKGGRDGTRN